mmetsp:Transcript_7293/g.22971  ORF Transcript_7293/g.22971 Transcript_7293/m.22971 type:complete len:81 (+) Transcript_7293:85-327(+)
MAVAEWLARKATHEADPFADEVRRTAPPAIAAGAGAAAAVTGAGQMVASSERVQRANGRVYFPIADCVANAFELSPKRWR